MVKDGEFRLKLYLLVEVLISVLELPDDFTQYTSVACGLATTVQPSVTVPPKFPLYWLRAIATTGISETNTKC